MVKRKYIQCRKPAGKTHCVAEKYAHEDNLINDLSRQIETYDEAECTTDGGIRNKPEQQTSKCQSLSSFQCHNS